jgi:hypothetical protein
MIFSPCTPAWPDWCMELRAGVRERATGVARTPDRPPRRWYRSPSPIWRMDDRSSGRSPGSRVNAGYGTSGFVDIAFPCLADTVAGDVSPDIDWTQLPLRGQRRDDLRTDFTGFTFAPAVVTAGVHLTEAARYGPYRGVSREARGASMRLAPHASRLMPHIRNPPSAFHRRSVPRVRTVRSSRRAHCRWSSVRSGRHPDTRRTRSRRRRRV